MSAWGTHWDPECPLGAVATPEERRLPRGDEAMGHLPYSCTTAPSFLIWSLEPLLWRLPPCLPPSIPSALPAWSRGAVLPSLGLPEGGWQPSEGSPGPPRARVVMLVGAPARSGPVLWEQGLGGPASWRVTTLPLFGSLEAELGKEAGSGPCPRGSSRENWLGVGAGV